MAPSSSNPTQPTTDHSRKLAQFLTEVSNWEYLHFLRERSNMDAYTSNQAIVFTLLDACCLENMDAIRLAINRLDGKLHTPVHVVYPKIYFTYPNAREVAPSPPSKDRGLIETRKPTPITHQPDPDIDPDNPELLPTLSIRETLAKMGNYPRSLPRQILDVAEATHQFVRGKGTEPIDKPLVKSVVAAHLHFMAQKRNLAAIEELFQSIDGKMTETIKIIGEDIYLTSFSPVAPMGATKNDDGVYQIEATKPQQMWVEKLGGTND